MRKHAVGATWRLVIANAPWAARVYHTSVIDAAGAIYVIGGFDESSTYYRDAWASIGRGARPDSVGGGRGVLWWVLQGLSMGHSGGSQGDTTRVLDGVLEGYSA